MGTVFLRHRSYTNGLSRPNHDCLIEIEIFKLHFITIWTDAGHLYELITTMFTVPVLLQRLLLTPSTFHQTKFCLSSFVHHKHTFYPITLLVS